MIHNLYKHRGETPLECIKRLVSKNPELKGEKLTYLGRLDPLAEGVLLVASGDDVKRKEEFLGLDKEYEFTSIFGFATDTYDILGKIVRVEKLENFSENNIRKVATVYEGEREQKYPPYSSKIRVWEAPHNNSFSPSRDSKRIKIYRLQFHKMDVLSSKELFGRLLMDISKVKGDFRQHEILVLWKQFLLGSEAVAKMKHHLSRFSAHVSSGTYIRALVNDMGNTIGCGATTLSIKRTRVGDYKIEDSIK